ncbi:SRPBCC family protein [Hufsiella ginkgonis]|uniref:Polyketide cyclase n=1 Tax=Hufsiella ginkgonis TaxID=2695274 RepID=A0A7K1Y0W6_9SPHI|nr:SRPBCC family protein [Hufsiella ginkgonis]MXV16728.1 polyketide cyclase [Hufsiella ginkgonis]
MSNNSVTLHRVLKASPGKIYRAFTEAAAIASWLPPYGFVCTVHQMDVRVEGTFKMSFTNFTTGNSHSFGGKYLALKPGEFIKYTDSFDDPNMPGEMPTTVWLKQVSVGTDIKITQENIPLQIPAEMCYLGWQDSLEKLAKLVEPEIPDA